MNFTILDIFYILKKVDKFRVQDIFTPLISFEVFIVSGHKKMRQCGNEALLDIRINLKSTYIFLCSYSMTT